MAETLRNGCTTVNCGTVLDYDAIQVELLGKGRNEKFSSHLYNIVCSYAMINGKKVEITYFENPNNIDDRGHEVYFFHSRTANHHYISRKYNAGRLPAKYEPIGRLLQEAHRNFF